MIRKIFSAIFGVALMSLLVGIGSILGMLYQDMAQLQETKMKEELQFVATGVEQFGVAYLDRLPASEYRISWIDKDGRVVFDNRADVATLDNHANREEVYEAAHKGRGISKRHSDTLVQNTLYLAKRLDDGSVLRLSVQYDGFLLLLRDFLWPALGIVFFLVLFSAFAASRLARQIIEPLRHMHFHGPKLRAPYPELHPIIACLQEQQQKNQEQFQRLMTKKKHFDQITESMQEGFILLDAENRVEQMNQFARNVIQRKKPYQQVSLFDLYRKRGLREAFEELPKRGFVQWTDTRSDKVYLWKFNPIVMQDQCVGTLILIADTTDRVMAEQHRKEFTANVSHELKTPLQTIIGSAELLESGVVKPEDQAHFIGHIRKEASRLVTLIRDILHLSRLDDAKVPDKVDVSIRNIVNDVVEVLHPIIDKYHVQMHVLGDEGAMRGIPGFLFEVFYNLCENAVKYNHPHGRVYVTIQSLAHGVQVEVKDTGIGIPYEYQEKVFERFYRVDKSHSKQSGGTGLGLSIVKHAVQHHNGTITLESREGEGTKITVFFPFETK